MPLWLFRAVFLLPRPYEITSLKSNIVKSIEAYYMYSILLLSFISIFSCLWFVIVAKSYEICFFVSIICLSSKWFVLPVVWNPGNYDFFVITHTCAQNIRELRFWWKNFLFLPLEWCKWHINIVSSLNNIFFFRDEIVLDSRHHFWLLVKKNYKWNWKNLFSKSFEKNLPVSNSILPTITVPFLAVFRNVKRKSHNTISMEFLVFV